MYVCEWCGSGVTASGEHIRKDLAPCFGVTYQYDYLGPDPNDPTGSGEKWGWISEDGQRLFEPGDKLDDGSEFICYTEDGSPIWKEPVPFRKEPVKVEKKLARLGWRWATESRNRFKNYIGFYLYERFKV